MVRSATCVILHGIRSCLHGLGTRAVCHIKDSQARLQQVRDVLLSWHLNLWWHGQHPSTAPNLLFQWL